MYPFFVILQSVNPRYKWPYETGSVLYNGNPASSEVSDAIKMSTLWQINFSRFDRQELDNYNMLVLLQRLLHQHPSQLRTPLLI